jgi:MFS family permease
MTTPSPRLVMMAALLCNLIGFANYAAVLPALRAATALTEVQAGIAGGAFFLSYAIGSPIFAGLTDTRDVRRLYMLGGCLGIAGGLLFPFASDGFAALVASRILTGLGMAGTYMPGLRLLIENLPPERQQQAAGDYVSTLTLGLSASFGLSGLLQWFLSWEYAFLGAAVTALLGMVLVRITMPSPRMTPTQGSLLGRLFKVMRLRDVWLVLLASAGNSWEGMAYRTWWVALLGFVVLLPGNDAYAGLNFALATAAVGPLAMPLSAWVARRAEAGRRYRVIALAAATSVVVSAVLAGALTAPFPLIFALSVIYLCAIFWDSGALTPAVLTKVPREDRGAALALQSAASNLGAFTSTIVFGLVLHATGGAESTHAWRMAILGLAAGSAVTALAMLVLDRRGAVAARADRPHETNIQGGNRA